jgi:hypothetical protein
MPVSVAKFEGLDTPRTGVDSVADCAGTGAGESALAILFPHLVQRLESRRRERLAGLVERASCRIAVHRAGIPRGATRSWAPL